MIAKRQGKRRHRYIRGRSWRLWRWPVEQGHMSARRSAELLGVSIEGLEELFSVHGLDCAIDL